MFAEAEIKQAEMESAEMGSAEIKSRMTPRPVFCVIEKAYRNRDVAEEVCAGRFTHIGITLELGVEPDWMARDLPADEEWRIEWSKFYYGLDLGHALRETGDHKYLRSWERLVRTWIDQVPVGFDTSDVTGRRVQNWIYAWNLFASSPGFTGLAGGLEEQITTSIAHQIDHLRNHLTPERNHRTLELYALFITALALPEVDRDGSLNEFAIAELHRNLMSDIRADGVHRESSTHYHMTVLRSFLGVRENARRFGLALPDQYDERLEQACEFAAHCHRPDGLIPALSDSDTGSYGDLLELAASIFSRPDFLYAATAGQRGVAPRKLFASFPDGGYFIQRSGWGEGRDSFGDERYLIFDCGPLGDGGHGHYDLLNVEIAARGRPLVIDPGRYTYSEQAPNWRRWFKSTAAHNTVSVDGLDQTPYRRGKPKGPIAQGRFIKRLSAPGFDVLCGEATSPAYEVVHTRQIFFIAGEYWIIADRLRGARPHRFDLRFHLLPESEGHLVIEELRNNVVARTPECALVFHSASRVKIEQGWYAPTYGIKHTAPVVSLPLDDVTQADFFTLVFPLKPGRQVPVFQVHSHETEPVTIFEISNPGPGRLTTDAVAWSESKESFALGLFNCRASACWLRKSAGRESLRACDVRELRWVSGSKALFFGSENPARWVMWDDRNGITLDDGREL
ncbi:MAG TPA: alginate lyase family protein [Blastocatellia bacterium]|nr:alginate lyase family protein [Blastocatellia bacterium]